MHCIQYKVYSIMCIVHRVSLSCKMFSAVAAAHPTLERIDNCAWKIEIRVLRCDGVNAGRCTPFPHTHANTHT